MKRVDMDSIELLKQENMAIKQKNEELDRENQLLKTILDCIHDAVYATNEKGEIVIYNSEVEKAEGMKRADVLGKNEKEIYSFITEHNFCEEITAKIVNTLKPIINRHYRFNLPNGRMTDILIDSYPFFYKDKLAGVYTIGRDIKQINNFNLLILELQKALMLEEKNPKYMNGARYFLKDIVGVSNKICETVSNVRKVAKHDSPVLIVGETGTGKELFAQGIHNASLFSKGPFIPVNCAAIPDTLLESVLFGTVKGAFTGAVDIPGIFEQAENGTIFLDEINSMPFPLQAKLLRVLQDKVVRRIGSKIQRPVNCRIISATNIDPFVCVNEKVIRSDLIFRLATITIEIPPLRERKEDIKVLSEYFIKKYNTKFSLAVKKINKELTDIFEHYSWPGNVRELENIIESGLNFVEFDEEELTMIHLPLYFRNRLVYSTELPDHNQVEIGTLRSRLLEYERRIIEQTLDKNNWNVTKSAKELEILRQNLHYKIRVYKLKKKSLLE